MGSIQNTARLSDSRMRLPLRFISVHWWHECLGTSARFTLTPGLPNDVRVHPLPAQSHVMNIAAMAPALRLMKLEHISEPI